MELALIDWPLSRCLGALSSLHTFTQYRKPLVIPGILNHPSSSASFPSEAVLSAMTTLPLLVGHSCSSFQSHLRYCLLWGALLEPSLPHPPIRVDSLLHMHRALTVHVIVTNMSSLVGSEYLKGSRGFHCSFLSLAPTPQGWDIVDAQEIF